MKWIEKIKFWRVRKEEVAKHITEPVAKAAKKNIEKVIDQPIVRELFQTDDDLGYC